MADIVVSVTEDSPLLLLLCANDNDAKLYASAAVKCSKGRPRIQLSSWQTEDGEHVDSPTLTRQGTASALEFLKQSRQT